MLFAGQNQFCRGERGLQQSAFLGDARRVNRDEAGA